MRISVAGTGEGLRGRMRFEQYRRRSVRETPSGTPVGGGRRHGRDPVRLRYDAAFFPELLNERPRRVPPT